MLPTGLVSCNTLTHGCGDCTFQDSYCSLSSECTLQISVHTVQSQWRCQTWSRQSRRQTWVRAIQDLTLNKLADTFVVWDHQIGEMASWLIAGMSTPGCDKAQCSQCAEQSPHEVMVAWFICFLCHWESIQVDVHNENNTLQIMRASFSFMGLPMRTHWLFLTPRCLAGAIWNLLLINFGEVYNLAIFYAAYVLSGAELFKSSSKYFSTCHNDKMVNQTRFVNLLIT